MSAAAAFEFDTKSDIKQLFERLKKAWKPGPRRGRSLLLSHHSNPQLRMEVPAAADDQQPEIAELLKTIEPVAIQAVAEIAGDVKNLLAEGRQLQAMEESTTLPGPTRDCKDWECVIDYYYYTDEDRSDLVSVAEAICEAADGDVLYFRDPQAMCGPGQWIAIKLEDLLSFEPDMSDPRGYVIMHGKGI